MVSIIRKPPGQMTPAPGRTPNPFTVDRMPGGAPAGTGGQGRPIGGGRTPNPFTVDARPIGPGGMNPAPRPGMPGSATGPTPNIGGFPVNDRGTGSTPTPKIVTPNQGGTLGPGSQSVADGINWASRAGSQVASAAGNLFGKSFFQKGGLVKKAAGGKVAAKPVAKKAGGKVAAKPMGKPVMKKAGGRVAAKPMAKGHKK